MAARYLVFRRQRQLPEARDREEVVARAIGARTQRLGRVPKRTAPLPTLSGHRVPPGHLRKGQQQQQRLYPDGGASAEGVGVKVVDSSYSGVAIPSSPLLVTAAEVYASEEVTNAPSS